MAKKLKNAITDIKGIRVGQAKDEEAITGCTVVLCEKGAVGGVDQRGSAPGTRETDALNPIHLVEQVHAVVLAGGSAFGLEAATGVVRYLEERGVGLDVRAAKVPIVPAAILFDLGIGHADVRPDAAMGYEAASQASNERIDEGSVGAGTGATVGKILGMGQAMKAGIGTASMEIGGGVLVGAIVAVNSFGDVIDPSTGKIVAGARTVRKGPIQIGEEGFFADTMEVMRGMVGRTILRFASRQNTVIGVVATNAKLTKAEATKVAQMAQSGVARTIRPAFTMFDGDTMFVLATGRKRADVSTVGAFAAEVVEEAILRGVREARGMGGVPALGDLIEHQGIGR